MLHGALSKGKNASGWILIGAKRPKARQTSVIKIARDGGESVAVKLTAFNPPSVTRASLDGFAEGEGYVSIEAEHFSQNIPAARARWEKIEGYGRTLSAMSILPMTAQSVTPPEDSPRLEYRMYLFNPQKATVHVTVAPTLNFVPDRALRYAISFDDQPPQTIDIVPRDSTPATGTGSGKSLCAMPAAWCSLRTRCRAQATIR